MIETNSTPMAPTAGRLVGPMADGPATRTPRDGDVPPEVAELVIRPVSGWIGINWREMWTHRELLRVLIWRDISVRYKQTVLGVAWAIVQPTLTMVIFTLIFGRFAKVPSEGYPYPVFVFTGLIPWTLFSQGMSAAALSLINQQHLLTKIYFPRLFVPIAAAGVFLVDLLISLGIYAVIMLYYGVAPSWGVVWLPALIMLTFVATLGPGITLAALTVFYRDFKHIIPFLIQILMYVSPVIYPMSMIDWRWRLILSFNPMFGIINAYRSALLGLPWDPLSLSISTASSVVMFVYSLYYFRKTERQFADFA